MKLDLVSFWPPARAFLQDPVTGLFPSDSLSARPGWDTVRRAANTPAGWARVPVQRLHHAEPSPPQERPPPDPEGPCPVWQLGAKAEADSAPVPCAQLPQAAWRPAARAEEGRARGRAAAQPRRPSSGPP